MAVPVQCHRRGVRLENLAGLVVDENDGVRFELEQLSIAILACAQSLIGLLSLGDVAEDEQPPDPDTTADAKGR